MLNFEAHVKPGWVWVLHNGAIFWMSKKGPESRTEHMLCLLFNLNQFLRLVNTDWLCCVQTKRFYPTLTGGPQALRSIRSMRSKRRVSARMFLFRKLVAAKSRLAGWIVLEQPIVQRLCRALLEARVDASSLQHSSDG